MPGHFVAFKSDEWRLNGCVHLPDVAKQKIGVLIVHESTKFGTHGIFRRVADALAEAGFYALRYDNRGTCDSPGDCELTFQDRVADACAAAHFFKAEYKLDKLLLWGLCMGAAVAVHCNARLNGSGADGMILCSLLADPVDASLPEVDYKPVTFSAYFRRLLIGGPKRRLEGLISDRSYRANVLRSITFLVQGYLRTSRFRNIKAQIGRVGPLLAQYNGLSLLVFGDADPYWSRFTKHVNVNDRLRLCKMKSPPRIFVVPGGAHMFNSTNHTTAVIHESVSWAVALRDGQKPTSDPGELYAIFTAPDAN